ncbi:DMT family transporter [Vagococcus sp. DIV0080]|uniref:DMT family transporter n=1 Tax=Candidatus Vagococcus giribetii TaxID=2230876 RepID=A0ABS3HU88_9ENTE|nr:DMT family transporter [Vagococcus sp. DIV0080]MBO0477316.1 DMT family transporter [Vagococcus sp. DIV0080]
MGKKNGVFFGLFSGILWALDTILMGIILNNSVFKDYVFVAPFIATFLHDLCSSIFLLVYNIICGRIELLKDLFNKRSSLIIVFAAIFGGPLGMTGYILSIKYIGASNTAIISAMYPAVGMIISYIFLKEKITRKGLLGLVLVIISTMILGMSASEEPKNLLLGLLFSMFCVFGWGCESVIISYGLKEEILPDIALQIRQGVSAIVYGILIIPIFTDYGAIFYVASSNLMWLLIVTSIAGSVSYLFYYRAIDKLGPVKAMGLNISYSAWAVILGLLFGGSISILQLILCILVITGSLLSTDSSKELQIN